MKPNVTSAVAPAPSTQRRLPTVSVVLAVLAVLASMVAGAGIAEAQTTYNEGSDYKFFADLNYQISGSSYVAQSNWNLYGGPVGLPYYIHTDVIAAGYESAVRSAFQTMQDDPGSDITFVYRGSTNVLSEISGTGGSCCPNPQDNFNVVSFGDLPLGAIGLGGYFGEFNIKPNGQPAGSGDGHFDITLSNAVLFADGPVSGAIDVESLVLHELGHAMSLDHPTANTSTVMWHTLTTGTTRRSLHPADRAGLAILYPVSGPQPTLCNGRVPTLTVTPGVPLVGTSGDDVIYGTAGADVIDGGAGDDTICSGAGDDVIVGGIGDDTIDAGAGADLVRGQAGVDIIDGGDGDDRLLGGVDGDTISGGNGNDYIGGFGGNDVIDGGPGNEKIFGGFGADVIDGGSGDDEIHGLVGNDTISGGDGNDELDGDRGNDTISGGADDDVIRGGNANDVLSGDNGNDNVSGGKADDLVRGGAGNDICVGNSQIVADTPFSDCETSFGFP